MGYLLSLRHNKSFPDLILTECFGECCTNQGLDAWLVLMLHEKDGVEETSQVVKIPAEYFLKALWNKLARVYHL